MEKGHDVDVCVLFPSDWLFERDAWDEQKRAAVMKGQANEVEWTARRESGKSSGAGLVGGVAQCVIFGIPLSPMFLIARGFANRTDRGSRSSDGGGSSSGGSSSGGGHGGGSY